jgi:hypothetical protein
MDTAGILQVFVWASTPPIGIEFIDSMAGVSVGDRCHRIGQTAMRTRDKRGVDRLAG